MGPSSRLRLRSRRRDPGPSARQPRRADRGLGARSEMSYASGPNVRKLGYFKTLGQVGIAFNREPDGQWAVHMESSQWPDSRTVRGATDEAAAGLAIAELERLGEFLPEPPPEFHRLPE